MNIIVAEEDPILTDSVVDYLQRRGHATDIVHTGKGVHKRCENADLLLLDLGLSDSDGLEICRSVRTLHDIPIISFAEPAGEVERVLALNAGADDCLAKPFNLFELIARIEAVMRRYQRRLCAPQNISRGRLYIDQSAHEVQVDGRSVTLTRREFDLLFLLAANAGVVVTRDELMSKVWDDLWAQSQRTIDTHISSLRRKLGVGVPIITVRGVGYRLA